MANIQQSINSMLASGTAAAFLATQNPAYKKQAAIQAEKKVGKNLAAESKALEGIIEDPASSENKLISSYERSKELDEELYQHNLSMYKNTGDKKYLNEALLYTPSQRKAYDELITVEKENMKNKQEGNVKKEEAAAMKSYTDRALTLENTLAALNERKDLLSAKQRGQLSTITHTVAKKGGFN